MCNAVWKKERTKKNNRVLNNDFVLAVCHQAQLIAQSIGQAFSVAYQEFLRANGINPEDLSQKEYSDIINTQEMYNDDLIHFSNSENCKEVGRRERRPFFSAGVFICISAGNRNNREMPSDFTKCSKNPTCAAGPLEEHSTVVAVN